MEETNNTNYAHVEGQVDPTVTSTITTSTTEIPNPPNQTVDVQDARAPINTEDQGKTVKMPTSEDFKKSRLTEKESKMDKVFRYISKLEEEVTSLRQKTGIVAAYTQQLGKVTSDQVNDLTNALLTIYKDMYSNCKVIQEVDILDTEVEQYFPIIGSYFSYNQEVIRIIAIETGWVVKESKPGEGTIEVKTPNGVQQVPFSDVTFEYKGSELKAIDYPTSFSTQATNGNEAIMKLRTYLFSLKENTTEDKIIV